MLVNENGKALTYGELYSMSHTWVARHIAKDLLEMYGKDEPVHPKDFETVTKANCAE